MGNDDDNDDYYYDDDDVYYYYISPPSLRGNHKQDMTRTGLIYQRDWRERKIFCATLKTVISQVILSFLHISSGLRGKRVLSMNDE